MKLNVYIAVINGPDGFLWLEPYWAEDEKHANDQAADALASEDCYIDSVHLIPEDYAPPRVMAD